MSTSNANSPVAQKIPFLFGCDLWEHAYYMKYKSNRNLYLQEFIKYINWDLVLHQLKKHQHKLSPDYQFIR